MKLSKGLSFLGAALGVAVIAGSVVGGIALAADGSHDPGTDVTHSTPADPAAHTPDAKTHSEDADDDATEDANEQGEDANEAEDADHGMEAGHESQPSATHEAGDDHDGTDSH